MLELLRIRATTHALNWVPGNGPTSELFFKPSCFSPTKLPLISNVVCLVEGLFIWSPETEQTANSENFAIYRVILPK